MAREGAEHRLHTTRDDLSYNDERVLAEPTNEVFLINPKRILSGIGPRNALSIETCLAPELAVKV